MHSLKNPRRLSADTRIGALALILFLHPKRGILVSTDQLRKAESGRKTRALT